MATDMSGGIEGVLSRSLKKEDKEEIEDSDGGGLFSRPGITDPASDIVTPRQW